MSGKVCSCQDSGGVRIIYACAGASNVGQLSNDIAVELNNLRAINLIVLGTFVGATSVLTKDDMANGIVKYFEKKNIDNTLNLQAFEKGFAVGEAQKG